MAMSKLTEQVVDNPVIGAQVDEMVNANKDLNEAVKNINPTSNSQEAMFENQPIQEDILEEQELPIAEPAEPVFADVEQQQVANLGKIKNLLKASDEAEAAIKQRSKMPISDDDYLIIPNATEYEVEQALKSVTDVKDATTKQTQRFNINQIQDSEGVKNFINTVGDIYLGPKKTISTKELADELTRTRYTVYKEGKSFKKFDSQEEADAFIAKQEDAGQFKVEAKAPYSEDYLARIMDPRNPTLANPTDVYKMLMAQLDAVNNAERLARKVIAEGDNAPNTLLLEFDQALALAGELSKTVEKRQADIGRSLRMFGEARSGSTERITEAVKDLGGITGVQDRAVKFLALSRTEDKARVASNVFSAGAVKDIWYATWINGLLSSPITHLKNISANAMFGVYQIPERYLTSIVGKIRGNPDYIRANAVHDYTLGYFESIKDAFIVGGKAFKNNAPIDGMSKLELDKTARRNEFDIDFGDSKFAKSSSNALRYYGKFVTLPGRALIAEDEFFKHTAYMAEFKLLTKQKAEVLYKSKIDEGIDVETAQRMATDYLTDIRANPTDDIIKASTDRAKELTFTKELDGLFLEIQRGIQSSKASPLLRMFFPFVRTPTNLVIEATKRTPFAPILPSVRTALRNGGAEADAVMAKMGLGTSMIALTSYHAMGGKITGSGPTNYEQRKTLEATGWMPYSVVYNKSDLTEEEIRAFSDRTPVSVGEDKVYVSYQGLQPISTLLAIGATIGEYYEYLSYSGTDDLTTLEQADQIAMIASLAVYESISDLPMLQGYSDFVSIISGDPLSSKAGYASMLEKGVGKLSEFAIGGSPIGVWSSAMATGERVQDPTKSNIMLDEGGVSEGVITPATEGFWKSWKRYTSRIPFYSNTLPELLDPLTGEPVTVGKGNWGEAFNPFKNSEGKVADGYRALIKNAVPVYTPPRKIKGYQLSAEMYNEWIVLTTAGGELEEKVIDAAEFLENEDDFAKVQRQLKRTMSGAYQESLKELVEFYPELEVHLEGVDLQDAVEGVYSFY